MGLGFQDFARVKRAQTPDFLRAEQMSQQHAAGVQAEKGRIRQETMQGTSMLGKAMMDQGMSPTDAASQWGNMLRTGSFAGNAVPESMMASNVAADTALGGAVPAAVAPVSGLAAPGAFTIAGAPGAASGVGSSMAASNALAAGLGPSAAGMGIGSAAPATAAATGAAGAGAAGAGAAGTLGTVGATNAWNPVGWAALAALAAYGIYSADQY